MFHNLASRAIFSLSAPSFLHLLRALRLHLNYHTLMIRRRTFLASSLAAVFSCGSYSALLEPHELRVESVRARIGRLPGALDGFRVVGLSDFHLYPFTQMSFLKRAIATASALSPDLVVLLGDFVDSTVEAIEELAPALAGLKSRCGVFAVLGNHDHLKGAGFVVKTLRRHGIQVLVNESVLVPVGRSGLVVAGTDSLTGRFNMSEALQACRPEVPTLLLAHEPDVADAVASDGRVALQLSGHSHGGQVRFAGLERLLLPAGGRKYPYGTYEVGGLTLHTSRGLGTTGLPLRLGSLPEVTEVILTPRI